MPPSATAPITAPVGKHGVELDKRTLSPRLLDRITRDLTVTPKSYNPRGTKVHSFQVFKDDDDGRTLCVPPHYVADKCRKEIVLNRDAIRTGDRINITFKGTIRDGQRAASQAIRSGLDTHHGGIVTIPCGGGKCLARGTPVLMWDGSVRAVETIVPYEMIMGNDSTARTVLSTCTGRESMVRIHNTISGEHYTVNRSHIISLMCLPDNHNHGDIWDVSVDTLLRLPLEVRDRLLCTWFGVRAAITKRPPHTDATEITIDRARTYGRVWAYHNLCERWTWPPTMDDDDDADSCGYDAQLVRDAEQFTASLMNRDRQIRCAWLAGVVALTSHHLYSDTVITNATVTTPVISMFRTPDHPIVRLIVNSMAYEIDTDFITSQFGHEAYIVWTSQRVKHISGYAYIGDITADECDHLLYPIRLEELSVDDYYGFEIDGNRRFLLGDCTVTHNTVLAINEICHRQRKALVVVHKDFLTRQWSSRIEMFSDAKIGFIGGKPVKQPGAPRRVRGSKAVDRYAALADCDIVIATVQTLCKGTIPSSFFDAFGIVVIDECHHMAARSFSRALCEIYTGYMLGLSATPKRKDGLSNVFHWWMGPTLYYEPPRVNTHVQVDRYRYICSHPDFKEFTSWQGQRTAVDQIKTLSKLIRIPERNTFIVDKIFNRILISGTRILVLSERLEHLRLMRKLLRTRDRYLRSALHHAARLLESTHPQRARFLYREARRKLKITKYVGGMKPDDLKQAEDGHVIFSTYSMGEEALDLPQLNTVVLATPKNTILQSVGRILRTLDYEPGLEPLVIDMADELPMCRRKSMYRNTEYQQCKYTITDFNEHGAVVSTATHANHRAMDASISIDEDNDDY